MSTAVATTNLYSASEQWRVRCPDERFSTLDDLIEKTTYYRNAARESANFDLRKLVFQKSDSGEDVEIMSPSGNKAEFTNWGFDQLCKRVGAPVGYLRKLPAQTAASCLNAGTRMLGDDGATANLLWHKNGAFRLRAATSDSYSRIWNNDVASAVKTHMGNGWVVPPARPAFDDQPGTRRATAADVIQQEQAGGLTISEGDLIAPAGLYASDHDLFMFMVNTENRINDGSKYGLMPGFFIENSEVGAAALSITTFYLRTVCGNHIVWDASEIKKKRIVHRGSNDISKFKEFGGQLSEFLGTKASVIEDRINKLSIIDIGPSRDAIAGTLSVKVRGLSSRDILEAYDVCEQTEEVSPRSPYGIAQGLTRMSQNTQYADVRNNLDKLAGRVLAAYDF